MRRSSTSLIIFNNTRKQNPIKINPNEYFHIIMLMSALFGKKNQMNSHKHIGLAKNVEIEIQIWRLVR